MIKNYLLFISVLLFPLVLNAQRFDGGAMVGLTATQIDGDNLGGYNKPGIRAGGWVNTPISENLILQLELEFIQKGSKVSQSELKGGQYYHARLNYIQAPVLVKTSLMPRLNAEAGLAGAYLFNSLEDTDGYGFVEPQYPESVPFDQFELSGLIGLNYDLIERFILNVRFNYSLLPVRPHPGGQYHWLDRGQFNNAMLFSLYYHIN
jgi:hypothetical protein